MISSRIVAIGGISAIIVSILAYFTLQKTSITFHLEVFIEAEPDRVFHFVKDPKYFVEFTHEIKDVVIQANSTRENGVGEINYLVTHHIPHIGNHKVFAKSVIDSKKMQIGYETVHFNGFLNGDFNYKFNKAKRKDQEGTLLVEEGNIVMPWLLRDFANKSTITQHSEILQNIKIIVEMRTT